MHSSVLLVACAVCCAAAAHAAHVPPAPAPAAHRARREGVHTVKCPEGMMHHNGGCFHIIDDAVPYKHLEAAKPVRAKRMIGMLPDRAFHLDCPLGYIRLPNGECVSVREPPPAQDYVDYY